MLLGSITQWWANLKHIGGSAHKPLWSRSLTQCQRIAGGACRAACQPWPERVIVSAGRQRSHRYTPMLLTGAVQRFNKKRTFHYQERKKKITQKYAIQVNNHPSPPHKLPLQSYLVEPVLTLLSNLQLQRAPAKPGSDDNVALTARCSTVTQKSSSARMHHPFFY